LLTLVERKTRRAFVFKLKDKCAETVNAALESFLKGRLWVKSITFDNGSEFALCHTLPVPVYFAHPYSSWERGSNENFNGMLRRFIKKGRAVSGFSQETIDKTVFWINNLPRKKLDFYVRLSAILFRVNCLIP
jgi:IS30 family transposase